MSRTSAAYNSSLLYPAHDCLGVFGPTGLCYNGQCGCAVYPNGTCDLSTMPVGSSINVQPGVVCVGGASRGFADVCLSTANTPDRLSYLTTSRLPQYVSDLVTYNRVQLVNDKNYTDAQYMRPQNGSSYPVSVGDECTYRHPDYVNVFPRRRWCQHRNFGLSADVSRQQGALGNPFNATSSLRIFQLQFPIPLSDLLADYYQNGGLVRDVEGASLAYRELLLATYDTSTLAPGIVYGYVSNLYDGDSSQSMFNKVWSYMRVSMFVLNTETVQLQSLVFLDSVEGAADRYWKGGEWHYFDCESIGWYGATYAYLSIGNSTSKPACDCQLWHERNPLSGVCEPGCRPGYFGHDCTTVSITDVNCPYVVTTQALYQRADSCEPICLLPFCVSPVPVHERPFVTAVLNDNILAIAFLSLSVVGAAALFAYAVWTTKLWNHQLIRSWRSSPTPKVHRVQVKPKIPPSRSRSRQRISNAVYDTSSISGLHNVLSEQSTSDLFSLRL